MKTIQLTLTAAFLFCGAVAFAANNDAKADNGKADSKATAKVEAAATPTQGDAKADEDDLFIYRVTAYDPVGHKYTLMSEGSLQNDCDLTGPDACELTSPTALSSPIDKTTVDSGSGGIILHGHQDFGN